MTLELVEQRSMDALHVLLPKRTLPNSSQGAGNLVLSRQAGQVFSVLNVLPRLRKKQFKFVVGRLKQAEGAICSTVDDLDVFHRRPSIGLNPPRP
jgi:hypothetical protein